MTGRPRPRRPLPAPRPPLPRRPRSRVRHRRRGRWHHDHHHGAAGRPVGGCHPPEGVTRCDIVDQPGCLDPVSGLTRVTVPELEAFLATDFATGRRDRLSHRSGPGPRFGSQGRPGTVPGFGHRGDHRSMDRRSRLHRGGGAKFAAVTAELAGFAPRVIPGVSLPSCSTARCSPHPRSPTM